jgi:hypothetical protein
MRDSCQPRNPFCDRQAGCEAGRLNSEQINQAGHSMLLLRLDEELGFGPARPGDFGLILSRKRRAAVNYPAGRANRL